MIAKIAEQPRASWYGSWNADITTVVKNYVNAAERAGALALLVAYDVFGGDVPNRDCGSYSAGGARDDGAYAKWIKRPGESDGECKNGPPAGQWFQARAVEMARNAKW